MLHPGLLFPLADTLFTARAKAAQKAFHTLPADCFGDARPSLLLLEKALILACSLHFLTICPYPGQLVIGDSTALFKSILLLLRKNSTIIALISTILSSHPLFHGQQTAANGQQAEDSAKSLDKKFRHDYCLTVVEQALFLY
ncbi:MAG: hypothetical protein AB7E77_04710 [Desulfobulbus sp.]